MPTIWDIDEAERAKLNPWTDPNFNVCEIPELAYEDIAERVGLPVDNVSIEINEISGMTFLKLEDTPASYADHNKKYVQVQGEELKFDKITIPKGVSEKNLSYRDKFRDGDVHWSWMEWLGASASGKSITEDHEYVKLSVAASTDGDWSATVNKAPKLITVFPSYPCELKCHLAGWSDNDDTRAGIFLSRQASGTGSDVSIFFHRVRDDGPGKDGLQVWRIGTGEIAYVAWTDNDAWFRIRGWTTRCTSLLIFSYSSDGENWTDLYTLTQGTPGSCEFPASEFGIACGIFVQNWTATYNAVDGYFDHFEIRRILGPDGG